MLGNMLNTMNQSNNYNDVRNNVINELYPDPDNMTYEELLELGEKIGSVSRGMDEASKKKIKICRFSKDELGNNFRNSQCIICFVDFIKNEKIKFLKCCHYYHPACLDKWLDKEKKCPICKEEIIL